MPGPQPYANTLFRLTPLFTPPRGVGDAAPYKCYRLLPGWLFRFIMIPSKYTPYTAIAAALT